MTMTRGSLKRLARNWAVIFIMTDADIAQRLTYEEGGMVKREWYRDRYNSKKTWEVVKMAGGYYLRQYINGQQVNTGLRTTKAFIASIGIFEFERIA